MCAWDHPPISPLPPEAAALVGRTGPPSAAYRRLLAAAMLFEALATGTPAAEGLAPIPHSFSCLRRSWTRLNFYLQCLQAFTGAR